MRIAAYLLAFALVAPAALAELHGKELLFKGGDITSRWVPLAIDYDGPAPEGRITVLQPDTGKRVPATLQDGMLHFIAEGATPGHEITFRVQVEPFNEQDTHNVQVNKRPDEDAVDVIIDDQHFTTYHYDSKWKKPFLWPVKGEGGVGVTRNFPMDNADTPKFAEDHPHHKSFYTAYGEVDGVDLWAEGGNSGNQVTEDVAWGSGDAFGWIKAKNSWQDKDGKHLVTEEREYRFYATPERARLFDVKVTFSNPDRDVVFTDTKEGGIVSARMAPSISYRNANITNAHGDTGEANTWGKPSPWLDYSGDMEDVGWRGLAIFDHPDNLRHPTSWHVRTYGLMGANAFGYSYFNEKDYNQGLIPENGDYTIKAGEPLVMNYRVYVHSGNVDRARVADRYADYATPPSVAWAE